MSETGTGVTRLVAGLADPNVLSLDLAHNLVFFSDTNGLTDGGGSAKAVNNVDVANLTTGAVTVLLSEPFVDDPVFSGFDGGKIPDGIAVDPASHTLYYSTNNSFNPPSNDGIFKATYTVTGSGSTASASLGASTTLYSGANSFSPTTLSLDVTRRGALCRRHRQDEGRHRRWLHSHQPGRVRRQPDGQQHHRIDPRDASSETPSGTVGAAVADVAPVLTAGSTVTWVAGAGPVVADAGLATSSAVFGNRISAPASRSAPRSPATCWRR